MLAHRLLRSWKTPMALAGIGAVGFALGTWNSRPNPVAAQTPAGPVIGAGATARPSDYAERIVAKIYGNEPITREQLGEYLISRQGYNTLELLVNRRIIEHACKAKNIVVSDADVEASLEEDLQRLKFDRATFVKHYLKDKKKTLFEWKEDVVRPGLQMQRLCELEVKVEEEEIKRVFDSKFGERVACRLIAWPENEFKIAQRKWDELRKSEAEFDKAATQQPDARLASVGGRIDPIARGVAKDDTIEKIAFRLQPGEVSELFKIPGVGAIGVLRCEGRLPANATVSYEKVREELKKEVFKQKVAQVVPLVFKKLREEAMPEIFMPCVNHDPYVVKTKDEEDKLLKEEDKPVVPLPNQPQRPNR